MSTDIKLKYLITGTGRSGTVWAARFLTSVGIPCGHETIFDYRGRDAALKRLKGEMPLELSWASMACLENSGWIELEKWLPSLNNIEAESSYMAAPFLNDEVLQGTQIIHVVRNPIKVINSFCNYINYFMKNEASNSYEDFMFRHVPELSKTMPQYDRTCLFWVRWNKMVEQNKPALFYRVEDDSLRILKFLGKQGPYFEDKTINSFKKLANGQKFDINKIQSREIFQEFVDLGKSYGYSMQSEYLMI